MSKLGDTLRAAAAAAKAARSKIKETVEDVQSGADDVKEAVFDDGSDDEAPGDDVNPGSLAEMSFNAMDGMAGLITVVDEVGDAVTKSEERYTRKGKAPNPDKILEAVTGALEPTDGTDEEDGNDSIRAFFRGMLYSAVSLLAQHRDDRDDD